MLYGRKLGDDFAITGSRWLPAKEDANPNIMTTAASPSIWPAELSKYPEPVS